MNNSAVLVKINKIDKHPNADNLQIVSLFGTQVLVGLDTKEGDMMVYCDSNLVMDKEFLYENSLYRHVEKNKDPQHKAGFFDDNGRVKCIKLRGEISDGFLFPLSYLEYCYSNGKLAMEIFEGDMRVGYEFKELNKHSICDKYIPKVKVSNGSNKNNGRKAMQAPMFVEHFDTSQFMRNKHKIPSDTIVYLEEKVHGTSHRSGRVVVNYFNKLPWWKKLILKFTFKVDNVKDWMYLNGTRRVVHMPGKKNNSFHDNTMREEVLESIDGQLFKGEQLYMELFGYEKNGSHIQKGFPYGCKPSEYKAMLYRVTMNNEDGKVVDYSREYVYNRADELGLMKPYLFEKYHYNGTEKSMEELENRIIAHAQGQSELANDTLKEGVVVWFINDKGIWEALKYKSDAFRLKESSNKDKGIIDQEDIN